MQLPASVAVPTRDGPIHWGFDTGLGQPPDKRKDFDPLGDTIWLARKVFKGRPAWQFSDAAFRDVGERASAADRIVCKANGSLLHDRDGKGGADATVFAKLTTKPDLGSGDFFPVWRIAGLPGVPCLRS